MRSPATSPQASIAEFGGTGAQPRVLAGFGERRIGWLFIFYSAWAAAVAFGLAVAAWILAAM